MAWGLEARVPFLDKAFLEVSMNVDPKDKMFHKSSQQEVDEDGCPKMEKVNFPQSTSLAQVQALSDSTLFVKPLMPLLMARYL